MIYQNDQYYLQISIKQGVSAVKDTDCEEMIMKLGNVVKKKSTGELTYSDYYKCWLFPLTYEQSSQPAFSGRVQIQAWFSDHENHYYDSNVANLRVGSSIINKGDLEGAINGN